MDNLSHSVVGLAAGEFVHRSLPDEASPERQRTRHRLLLLTCWAASNFPDLDLVLTPLLPSPLGYLLHHRGHTHTLLYAIPQALLLWLLIRTLWPAARALLRESASARRGFLAVLASGFLLHIGMDFLNSYGVHPFHPLDSRWVYGDMVYILEPVFWLAFGAPLAMCLPGRVPKLLAMAALLALPPYFASRGFLDPLAAAALMAIALFTAWLQHRAGLRGRIGIGAAMAVAAAFIAVQGWTSALARDQVARALRAIDPQAVMVDAAMTAFPSQPFCWNFVSVEQHAAAGTFTLRRGVASAAPGIVPPAACPPAFAAADAPLRTAQGIAFTWEDTGDLRRLRALRAENCHVDAWLRFARMPAIGPTAIFDARYATSLRGNFTTMEWAALRDRACPRLVPPWEHPRGDLLAAPR